MGKFIKSIINLVALNWNKDYKKKINSKNTFDSISILKDIPYNKTKLKENTLDIYQPNKVDTLLPIIVDIHGGGFISGDKIMDAAFASALAMKNSLVYSINYRIALDNKITVYDEVDDINSALRYISKDAIERGGDLNNVYISGHSAGALLAVNEAIILKNNRLKGIYRAEDIKLTIKGLFLDSGFFEINRAELPYWGVRITVFPKYFENDERYKTLVLEKNKDIKLLPPCFIVTNKNDPLSSMSVKFKKLLEKNNINYQFICRGKEGHMGIIYNPCNRLNKTIIDDFFRFFSCNNVTREKKKNDQQMLV